VPDSVDKRYCTDAEKAAIASGGSPLTEIPVTGTTFTFGLTNLEGVTRAENVAMTTGTIPLQATVVWPDNTQMPVRAAAGSGGLTIAGALDVTVTGPSLVIRAGQGAMLIRTAANVWEVSFTSRESLGLANFKTIGGVSILGTGDIPASGVADQYLQYSTIDGGAFDTVYDETLTIDGGTF
jgi:hypothetical protein